MLLINGIEHYGLNQTTQKWFEFGDFVLCFPKSINVCLGKFVHFWFGLYQIENLLSDNTSLLVVVDKFYRKHVLVNINKLKPHRTLENTYIPTISLPYRVGNFTWERIIPRVNYFYNVDTSLSFIYLSLIVP